MIETGTRKRQNNLLTVGLPETKLTKSFTRDLGLASLVSGVSITFNSGTGQATAAGGTFANFTTGQCLLIANTQFNNGQFEILATDNSTYLTLDPPPVTETANATIRTS